MMVKTKSFSSQILALLGLGLLAIAGFVSAQDTATESTAAETSENSELAELYAGDQEDRKTNMHEADWSEISKRDAERRARVMEIVEAGEARVAADYFHAAMVFQHGEGAEDIRQARDWAQKATKLAPDTASKIHRRAKWLFAAATDRHLHRTDKPQIFGTQFRRDPGGGGPWTMEPFDRDAVSPEERKAHGVQSIEQQEERLAKMNQELEDRGLLEDDE